MAAKKDERTLKMMSGFMEFHNAGHSIKEIAELTGVSDQTIYDNLGDIAHTNNTTRESLLEKPHKSHSMPTDRLDKPARNLDLKDFNEMAERMRKIFSENSQAIDKMIKKCEEETNAEFIQ